MKSTGPNPINPRSWLTGPKRGSSMRRMIPTITTVEMKNGA
jgi:hypothetical protein